jgi:hypothetical protein
VIKWLKQKLSRQTSTQMDEPEIVQSVNWEAWRDLIEEVAAPLDRVQRDAMWQKFLDEYRPEFYTSFAFSYALYTFWETHPLTVHFDWDETAENSVSAFGDLARTWGVTDDFAPSLDFAGIEEHMIMPEMFNRFSSWIDQFDLAFFLIEFSSDSTTGLLVRPDRKKELISRGQIVGIEFFEWIRE